MQRAGQAQVEHDFVQQLLAVDKKADVVVVGDLNDYQFSPALSLAEDRHRRRQRLRRSSPT